MVQLVDNSVPRLVDWPPRKGQDLKKDPTKPVVEAHAEGGDGDNNELRRSYVAWSSPTLKNTTSKVETEDWFETEPLSPWAVAHISSLQLLTWSKNGGRKQEGSWTWFELSIRGQNDYEKPKKLPGGQSLAWFSHANNDTEPLLHKGRIFTKEDDMFKYLKPNDRISVTLAACPGSENIAQYGYLLLGFDNNVGLHYKLQLNFSPDKKVVDEPDLPLILACGQKRRDCFIVPDDGPSSTAQVTMIDGGVRLMRRFLKGVDWSILSSPEEPKGQQPPSALNFHSFLPFSKNKAAKGKESLPLKVGKQTIVTAGPVRQDSWQDPTLEIPKIVVWDDFGVNEKNWTDYILKPRGETEVCGKPKIILYQMHAPLCQGVLWKDFERSGESAAENLVVVIDMDDLRSQGFNISRGISWEKTMEDFDINIHKILDELDLPMYMHLIVRCGYEAAIYVKKRPINSLPLIHFVTYMVPNMAEGHILRPYDGRVPGIDLAFVTGLAVSLVKESNRALEVLEDITMGEALETAICRCHRFASVGFRQDSGGAIDYPMVEDLVNAEIPKPNMIHVDNGWFRNKPEGRWSLFDLAETWKEYIAAETVITGTRLIEACVPTAQYGPLKTADRREIEGFRSAEAVIKQYIVGNVKKPLSIAVFGQPGSGKSFGVKEVIKAVLNDDDLKPIEANLSQFVEYKDLVGIFDMVRDISSKNKDIPVVLFDEFDSEFGGKALGWLKYFLAPMQDNQYLQNGAIRSLGRAIFVFIGGTSSTFEDFKCVGGVDNQGIQGNGDREKERNRVEKRLRDEKQAKKPDFISRLSAHINVAGPNPPKRDNHGSYNNKKEDDGARVDGRDEAESAPGFTEEDNTDKMVIMRRAILLRSLLETRLDLKNKDIQVDQTLLMALLKHREFPHGSRSLELILQSSKVSSGQKLQPSALPPDSQLAMHLNLREYRDAMKNRAPETKFRPIDVVLYNKTRWAGNVRAAKP